MSYLDAFLLAIIQGITEFLPISSSAHLIILSYILETSSNLFYDVSLHLGTLIAVCAYFKNEISSPDISKLIHCRVLYVLYALCMSFVVFHCFSHVCK